MLIGYWVEQLGVEVVSDDLPGNVVGYFDHRNKTIYVDSSLSAIQFLSTVMHELGHAFYRHDACRPRWEQEASIWAARQMIDESDFLDAAAMFEGSVAVANELGVLPRDVDFYVLWRSKNRVLTMSARDFDRSC